MEANRIHGLPIRPYVPPGLTVEPKSKTPAPATGPGSFADLLQQMQRSDTPAPIRFSAHAMSRLEQRGMRLNEEDVSRLGRGVDQANQKGAKDAYLVYGNTGFVVNVPNRTVVTAMANQQGTVITNIDSVVFIDGPDR